MKQVGIGRDFGPTTEIVSGLKEGDTLITEITDDVTEGATVKPKSSPSPGENAKKTTVQPAPPGGPSQYGNQSITDQNMQGKQAQQRQGGKQQQGGKQKDSSGSESKP